MRISSIAKLLCYFPALLGATDPGELPDWQKAFFSSCLSYTEAGTGDITKSDTAALSAVTKFIGKGFAMNLERHSTSYIFSAERHDDLTTQEHVIRIEFIRLQDDPSVTTAAGKKKCGPGRVQLGRVFNDGHIIDPAAAPLLLFQ